MCKCCYNCYDCGQCSETKEKRLLEEKAEAKKNHDKQLAEAKRTNDYSSFDDLIKDFKINHDKQLAEATEQLIELIRTEDWGPHENLFKKILR